MIDSDMQFKAIATLNCINVLTVDAGIVGTGWCFWEDIAGKPNAYGVINPPSKQWQEKAHLIAEEIDIVCGMYQVHSVVIEFPSVWNTAKSEASAHKGDLFKLTYLIGLIAGIVQKRTMQYNPDIEIPLLVFPYQWKGQLNKDIVIERIQKKLGIAVFSHDADAIGMGLGLTGRL